MENYNQMLSQLRGDIVMDTSVPYYSDNTRYSNSSLGYYLKNGIKYFYKKMNDLLPPLSTKSLEKGTMVHKYILEREDFFDEYTLNSALEPSSANQKAFVADCINEIRKQPETRLKHLESVLSGNELVQLYRKNYATALKMSDEKALSEARDMYNRYIDYIEYVITTGDKITVSMLEYSSLIAIEKEIKNRANIAKFIYPNKEEVESHTEFHINWIHEDSKAECKSLIDRLIIDKNNKIIYIVDLKTSYNISDFRHSMNEYGYFRQLAFYTQAVNWYIKNIRKELNIEEYEIQTIIVPISTNPDTMDEVRIFKIEREELDEQDNIIREALINLEWHRENNQYDYSRQYAETGFDAL